MPALKEEPGDGVKRNGVKTSPPVALKKCEMNEGKKAFLWKVAGFTSPSIFLTLFQTSTPCIGEGLKGPQARVDLPDHDPISVSLSPAFMVGLGQTQNPSQASRRPKRPVRRIWEFYLSC